MGIFWTVVIIWTIIGILTNLGYGYGRDDDWAVIKPYGVSIVCRTAPKSTVLVQMQIIAAIRYHW